MKARKGKARAASAAPAKPNDQLRLAHPSYSVEWCPNCDYPEADGGYCPACGWSKPLPQLRPSDHR